MASISTEADYSHGAIEELLECAICLSRMRDPKVLACQHYFCKKCLKGCVGTATKSLKCAICRKVTKLSFEGIDGLPANFAVKGLLSLTKARQEKQSNSPPKAPKQEDVESSDEDRKVDKDVSEGCSNSTGENAGATSGKHSKAKGKKVVATVVREMVEARKDHNKNLRKPPKLVMVHLRSSSDDDSCSSESDQSSRNESSDDDSTTSDRSDDSSCSSLSDSTNYDSDSTSSQSDTTSDESSDSDESLPSASMAFGEMTPGSEVYVFSKVRKPIKGKLVHVKGYCRQLFAGVELKSASKSWIKRECEEAVRGTSLHQWWAKRNSARAIIHLDDCLSAEVVDKLKIS